MFEIAKTIPDLKVEKWKHIWRIYTHPLVGVNTVRTKRGVRAQLDVGTGEVLAVESYSRDSSEDLHQSLIGRHELRSGSPFGSLKTGQRFWVFLPAHLISVLLWLTGVIYFLKTTFARKRPGPPRMPSRAPANTDAEMEVVEQPIGGG